MQQPRAARSHARLRAAALRAVHLSRAALAALAALTALTALAVLALAAAAAPAAAGAAALEPQPCDAEAGGGVCTHVAAGGEGGKGCARGGKAAARRVGASAAAAATASGARARATGREGGGAVEWGRVYSVTPWVPPPCHVFGVAKRSGDL